MSDLCFIGAYATLKILTFPLGVLEVEQGLITVSIPLSAQELDRSKPAPVSKKECELECPEENLWILKGNEKYKVPSMEQGLNEKTLKDSCVTTTATWKPQGT